MVFLVYSRRERKPGSPGSEVEKPGGNQAARIRVDRQKTSSLEMSSFSERGRERRESDSVPDRTLATPCERLGTGARQFRTGGRRSAKAARVSVRIRYGGLTVNGFTMNSPNGVYHSIVRPGRPLGTSPRPVREVWVGWAPGDLKKRAFLYLWDALGETR